MSSRPPGGSRAPEISTRREVLPYLRALRRGIRKSLREAQRVDRRVVSLGPRGEVRGNVLVSYLVEGLVGEPGLAHTNQWEAAEIARSWADLGFRVDVINNYNQDFTPRRKYHFLVAARMALEALARRLDADCVKVLHIDTAHWLYHETAQYTRLLQLQERKGKGVRRLYPVGRNRAIEIADCATVLGNEFTMSTYRFAGKPLYRIPVSTPRVFPFPEAKDFDAVRNHFIWFGSSAVVHKGLDLVLDAFAGLPDYRLTVIGRIDDPDFEKIYARELRHSPNIHVEGWVDLIGPRFAEIAENCVGLVYPSCSEGGGASAITCMHAGLIPIVSRESSVDVEEDFGVVLASSSVANIRDAVRSIGSLPAAELARKARRAWSFARTHHTRETFAQAYRRAAEQIVEQHRPSVVKPVRERVADLTPI